MFTTSCTTLNPNQPIRVYSNNHRLTGYNSAFDVPLVFFTTNKQFYILLVEKETGEKK